MPNTAVDVERIDRIISDSMAEWRQPGLAAAITDADQTLYQRGFGVRRVGEDACIDEHTVFGIGSCTKPFAAASVAVLVDDGRLTWDDRVIDHIPDFRLHDPWVTHELTIRDLLCMRSGICSGEYRHRRLCADRADYIRRLRYHAPIHAFRGQFSYWTDGFTVLGEIVSRVTGRSWAEFVEARIWRPAGMYRTNADHRVASLFENAATPHEVIAGRLVPIPWVYEDHVALAAGGMNAPIEDLSVWLQLILGGGVRKGQRLISDEAMREMHTPHTSIHGRFAEAEFASVVGDGPTGIRFPSYALGWYTHDYRGHTVIYHTGKIDGFRSVIGVLPNDALGIAVLINSSNYLMQLGVFQSVLDVLLGTAGNGRNWSRAFLIQKKRRDSDEREAERHLTEARMAGTSPSMPLQEYAGTYADDGCYGSLSMHVDGGCLSAVAGEAQLRYELRHWHYDVFEVYRKQPYMRDRNGFARFSCDELGRVSALHWSDGAEFQKIAPYESD